MIKIINRYGNEETFDYKVSVRTMDNGLLCGRVTFTDEYGTCSVIPNIYTDNVNKLLKWIRLYIEAIYEQATDEDNNYSTLFYAYGYNSKAIDWQQLQAQKKGVYLV